MINLYKNVALFYIGAAFATIKHNTKADMDFQNMLDESGLPDEPYVRLVFSALVGALWPFGMAVRFSPTLQKKIGDYLGSNV